MRDLLEAVGHQLTQVRITALEDGVYFAVLVLTGDVEVSARPSDAIALALRTGSPIFGAEEVLEEAGIPIPDEQEDEVERFREFLDQISPGGLRSRGWRRAARPSSLNSKVELESFVRRVECARSLTPP